MARENLLSLFREFERYRRDIAIVQKKGYRRDIWTYAKLAAAAQGGARALKERGIGTGDRVMLWSPNSAEWVAVFWACLLRGAVAVPMDDGANPEFVARVVRDAGIKLGLATRERTLGNLPFDLATQLVDMEAFFAESKSPIDAHSTNVQVDTASFSDEPLTRQHIAEILFTSGTTSEPRGVVLTHGNFLANLEPLETGIASYCKYERWFHPLRFVTLVPLSHVFGQFMALFVPPLLGAGVALEASASPTEIIRSVKRERATALIAVPRMLESLHSGIERDSATKDGAWFARAWKAAQGQRFLRRAWIFRRIHRRLGWKFWAFISGGAALASGDEEFFKRLGYAVVQGYGMTETASLISLNHPFRATEGSIGKVLPGREFQLAEDGEILVRGENVSAGYWEAGSLRPAEDTGWLHTGDIGELDRAGNLRFRGRKKNVMVSAAGLNVYPEDLEAALRKQPEIRDSVVVPIERDGNAKACAVLLMRVEDGLAPQQTTPSHSGATETNRARVAVERANSGLAEYQRINNWILWPDPDFPRTATGKPRLAEIASRARQILTGEADLQHSQQKSSDVSRSSESLDQLIHRFEAHQPERSSGVEALDSDLSLTSLDRVELLSALEEKLKVELDETAFSNAKNVSDIQELLRQPAAQRSQYNYPSWPQTAVVRAIRLLVYYSLVWPATLLLAHPKIVGRGKIDSLRGPVLVISNHVTRRADIGLILAALPSRYRNHLATAMAGETLQNMRHPPPQWPFFKRAVYQWGSWLVIALFNVFPLPQRSGFRESFRFAGESADRGYSLLVFPEGEVTGDGRIGNFRSGIGLLTKNLGLPVIPMRIDGVWRMAQEHRRLARKGEITIRIGEALRFAAGTEPEDIAKALQAAVEAL
jgi:long-chain acyl-CoA synthetase